MIGAAVPRALVRPGVQVQRRTFINWMVNYPDRINEIAKAHQAGGRKVFTWCKQPTDKFANGLVIAMGLLALAQLIPAQYRLATGKGKIE